LPCLILIIQYIALFPVVPRVFHVVGWWKSSVPVLFSVFPVFLVCKEGNTGTGGNCADTEHREHWELVEFIV